MTSSEDILKTLPEDAKVKDKTWQEILDVVKVDKAIWKSVAKTLGDEELDDFDEIAMLTPEEFIAAFIANEVKPVHSNRRKKEKKIKKQKKSSVT